MGNLEKTKGSKRSKQAISLPDVSFKIKATLIDATFHKIRWWLPRWVYGVVIEDIKELNWADGAEITVSDLVAKDSDSPLKPSNPPKGIK